MDSDALWVKVREKELLLDEHELAIKRIELDTLRLQAKIRSYEQSVIAIRKQINDANIDLASLRMAHEKALHEVTNG